MKSFVYALSFFCSVSWGQIFVDSETDPLPLLEMEILVPVGFEPANESEAGVGAVLGEMLDSGTQTLNRQQFSEKLAQFGASFGIEISHQESAIKLSFPILEGKDYAALRALVVENWLQPRFDEATLALAKTKLKSSMQGSLDRDFALAGNFLRRWIHHVQLGRRPTMIEDIDAVTLEAVRSFHASRFMTQKEVWVGYVGPRSARSLVESMARGFFPKIEDVDDMEKPRPLKSIKESGRLIKQKPTLFILDKEGRSQSVFVLMAISDENLKGQQELDFGMGNHVLFGSGLASVFANEIREKRGLAYAVGTAGNSYQRKPVISLATNPLKDRSAEVMPLIAQLFDEEVSAGKRLRSYPKSEWELLSESFRNEQILGLSTPGGRLKHRQSVVAGDLSPELYRVRPDRWKLDQVRSADVLKRIFEDSNWNAAVVGDRAYLEPILRASFPKADIRVIPFRQSISKSWLGNAEFGKIDQVDAPLGGAKTQ